MLRIPLALGCSKQGHGDVLWAAAELAADAVAGAAEFSVHGLGEGARVLELGAGLPGRPWGSAVGVAPCVAVVRELPVKPNISHYFSVFHHF